MTGRRRRPRATGRRLLRLHRLGRRRRRRRLRRYLLDPHGESRIAWWAVLRRALAPRRHRPAMGSAVRGGSLWYFGEWRWTEWLLDAQTSTNACFATARSSPSASLWCVSLSCCQFPALHCHVADCCAHVAIGRARPWMCSSRTRRATWESWTVSTQTTSPSCSRAPSVWYAAMQRSSRLM